MIKSFNVQINARFVPSTFVLGRKCQYCKPKTVCACTYAHIYSVMYMHSVLPPCMCTHDRAHVCQVHGSFVMELYVVALTAAANLVLVHYNTLGYI